MSSIQTDLSKQDLLKRVIRFQDLIPCKTAFIDAKTPGSDQKENFCLVGPGVSENPDQHIHIKIPHGFNVGAAKQPKGCKNSHHSHETEEVFLVHKGSWQFTIGEHGQDAQITLNQGDIISIPTNVFRGFENVGEDDGFLFCILGKDDPGHVTWAPYVFENAKKHGLVLLDDGRLVDTSKGEKIPEDGVQISPTTADEAAKLIRLTAREVEKCVVTQSQLQEKAQNSAPDIEGVAEVKVIAGKSDTSDAAESVFPWPHCFSMTKTLLAPIADQFYISEEDEVIFVHEGGISVEIDDNVIQLSNGDLITIPAKKKRRITNVSEAVAELLKVQRA